jgi:hypothetical protein
LILHLHGKTVSKTTIFLKYQHDGHTILCGRNNFCEVRAT